MPDISMCTDKSCPMRIGCYRFRATVSKHERQSYFAQSPRRGQKCQHYLAVREGQVLRPLEECDK